MWFYYALLSAFTNAIATVARRTHGSSARPIELAWWTQLLFVPCSLVILLLTKQSYWSSHNFLLPAFASATLNSFASVLLFDAYKYGEASVISPLGNLLPIGLLLTSFLLLGTIPSAGGLLGILLVVFGVYYSSVSGKHSLLHPFKAIWHQRGSRAMLACVMIWSISTIFDKIALRSASPAFLLLFISAVGFVFLSMYLSIQKSQRKERVLKHWWRHILIIAIFSTVAIFFQMKAIATASTSYVLAVKRLDILFVILFAGLFLHERHLLRRFEGSVIALIGVIIIFFYK